MKTLYEMKESMTTIGNQLQKKENELAKMAADDTNATIDDIKNLKQTVEALHERFGVVKEQHDKMEAEQRAQFSKQDKLGNLDPKEQKVKAKAELIQATMAGRPLSSDVVQVLGDDGTGGGKFLPKTVANDIITEPLVKNQLRGLSAFTSITNLEIPKVD